MSCFLPVEKVDLLLHPRLLYQTMVCANRSARLIDPKQCGRWNLVHSLLPYVEEEELRTWNEVCAMACRTCLPSTEIEKCQHLGSGRHSKRPALCRTSLAKG